MKISDLKTITLGPNGYPVDKKLAATIYKLRREIGVQAQKDRRTDRAIYIQTAQSKLAKLIEEAIKPPKNTRSKGAKKDNWKTAYAFSKRLLAKMLKAGSIKTVSGNDKWSMEISFNIERNEQGTQAAALENYDAALRSLAKRTVHDDIAAQKLYDFIKRSRNLYGFLILETPVGPGVLFPVSQTISSDGPIIDGAFIVVSRDDKVAVYTASTGALSSITWADNQPHAQLNWNVFEEDEALCELLGREKILPHFAKKDSPFLSVAVSKISKSIYFLANRRETVSKLIGEEIDVANWRSFVTSFYNVKQPNHRKLAGGIMSIVRTDVRKIALRINGATYGQYNGLLHDALNEKRVIQASDAFPILTRHFFNEPFLSAIMAEQPLIPVITNAFGTSTAHVRRLHGIHWQKMGHLEKKLEPKSLKLIGALDGFPPENMPSNKMEWDRFFYLVGIMETVLNFVTLFPRDVFCRLSQSLHKDRAETISSLKFIASVMSDYTTLALCMINNNLAETEFSGELVERKRLSPIKLRALIFAELFGPNFGLKKMRTEISNWHRGVARRVVEMKILRRQQLNIPPSSWDALTETFVTDKGSIAFLTDEDQLAREGVELNHCVGTYYESCLSGHSYIAALEGKDGTRSTVEFILTPTKDDKNHGKLHVIQHQTHNNHNARGDVVEVLNAFMSKYKNTKFQKIIGEKTQLSGETKHVIPLTDQLRKDIAAIYQGCLPEEWFYRSYDDWNRMAHSLWKSGLEDDHEAIMPAHTNEFFFDEHLPYGP